MKKRHLHLIRIVSIISLYVLAISCDKMLDIKDPVNSITTNQVFQNDDQASVALNGLYSFLIHGEETEAGSTPSLGFDHYSAGAVTLAAGYLADELYDPTQSGQHPYYSEVAAKLSLQNPGYSIKLWNSAYKGIFNANALLEGERSSRSKEFTDAFRKRVKGEALAVRAMSYFYLVNLFEKIPLALSIDFNQTKGLPAADLATIYKQIVDDLEEASGYLQEGYNGNNTERIRINKWFVKAFLARVYLFTKNYEKALEHTNDVIGQSNLFKLEPLQTVFTCNSKEVIFQLKQNNTSVFRGNATPEGYAITGLYLSPLLLNSFEPGDNRKSNWTSTIDATIYAPGGTTPAKYKTNQKNQINQGVRSEYYVVMRLAEMYLIRAEALLHKSAPDQHAAIKDLNAIRGRAGLNDLPYSLDREQIIDAIANEKQHEFFAEWGHRWFDLKRTNTATLKLGNITYKQPWNQHQLLYPIPTQEILWDNNLSQNKGYE